MLYHSKEARDSAQAKISELIAKVISSPGNHLNYTDACAISRYLAMLSEEIERQGLKAEHDARIMCEAATLVPKEKVYAYAIFHLNQRMRDELNEAANTVRSIEAICKHVEMMNAIGGEIETLKTEMKLETGKSFEDYTRE